MTGIRKKNRRNVQKKITDAKGFRGEQTKKERKKKRKRKEKKKKRKKKKKKKKKLPAAPGVPRRSPIQVLTGPDVA